MIWKAYLCSISFICLKKNEMQNVSYIGHKSKWIDMSNLYVIDSVWEMQIYDLNKNIFFCHQIHDPVESSLFWYQSTN